MDFTLWRFGFKKILKGWYTQFPGIRWWEPERVANRTTSLDYGRGRGDRLLWVYGHLVKHGNRSCQTRTLPEKRPYRISTNRYTWIRFDTCIDMDCWICLNDFK